MVNWSLVEGLALWNSKQYALNDVGNGGLVFNSMVELLVYRLSHGRYPVTAEEPCFALLARSL